MDKHPLRRRLEQAVCSLLLWSANLLGRALPVRLLWCVADVGALFVMGATPRRQRMAEANIAATFPELSPQEVRRIRRQSVRGATRTMLEALKLPVLSGQDLERLVECDDLSEVMPLLHDGRGAVLVSAHFGNWEWVGAYGAHMLGPLTVISRETAPTRPVVQARMSKGITLIARRDTGAMLRVLKDGGMLAMLVDQHAARGGILVDFLGRPAWTSIGPAVLAARTGAHVIPGFLVRRYQGRPFKFEMHPEVQLVKTGDREADVRENTRRINVAIELAIRAHPDNWLWLHNRWKPLKPVAPAD